MIPSANHQPSVEPYQPRLPLEDLGAVALYAVTEPKPADASGEALGAVQEPLFEADELLAVDEAGQEWLQREALRKSPARVIGATKAREAIDQALVRNRIEGARRAAEKASERTSPLPPPPPMPTQNDRSAA